jgi:AAA15 family ATPase/GTPase
VFQLERIKVYFVCQAGNDRFTLSYDEQSEGTKKFLSNLSALYSAVTGNHVFLIDEIDSELHDDLLLFYLNTFIMNSKESQLLFTSQETSLLNEDLLNTHRDFVFFVEKNRDGAYSEYTRADEFGLHKNLSLYKSYRNGRLGAVPQLGSPLLYLENDEED